MLVGRPNCVLLHKPCPLQHQNLILNPPPAESYLINTLLTQQVEENENVINYALRKRHVKARVVPLVQSRFCGLQDAFLCTCCRGDRLPPGKEGKSDLIHGLILLSSAPSKADFAAKFLRWCPAGWNLARRGLSGTARCDSTLLCPTPAASTRTCTTSMARPIP